MILSIISIILAISAIVYCGHCAIVFQKFNDGIRDWSMSLDDSTREAINRSARNILKELDEKISSINKVDEDGNLTNNFEQDEKSN